METRKVQEGGARTQRLEEKGEDTRGWEHGADRRKRLMRDDRTTKWGGGEKERQMKRGRRREEMRGT